MKIFILLWLGLQPLFCCAANAEPAAGKVPRPTARQLYRQGQLRLEAGRYPEAIGYFQSLIDGFPSDALVPSARKYLAIAARAQKKAAAEAAKPSARDVLRPVLRPLVPEERPAADTEPNGPVKGDPAKCKPHHDGDQHRYCSWHDALAYCEGKLPTVVQLQELNMSECPAGKHDGLCGCRYWSSEDDGGSRAKTVIFGNGGEINSDKKTFQNIFVLCAGANGIR